MRQQSPRDVNILELTSIFYRTFRTLTPGPVFQIISRHQTINKKIINHCDKENEKHRHKNPEISGR